MANLSGPIAVRGKILQIEDEYVTIEFSDSNQFWDETDLAFPGSRMKVFGQIDRNAFTVGKVILAKGKLHQPYWDSETAEIEVNGQKVVFPVRNLEASIIEPDHYDPLGVDNEAISIVGIGMFLVLFLVLCMITLRTLAGLFRLRY